MLQPVIRWCRNGANNAGLGGTLSVCLSRLEKIRYRGQGAMESPSLARMRAGNRHYDSEPIDALVRPQNPVDGACLVYSQGLLTGVGHRTAGLHGVNKRDRG